MESAEARSRGPSAVGRTSLQATSALAIRAAPVGHSHGQRQRGTGAELCGNWAFGASAAVTIERAVGTVSGGQRGVGD